MISCIWSMGFPGITRTRLWKTRLGTLPTRVHFPCLVIPLAFEALALDGSYEEGARGRRLRNGDDESRTFHNGEPNKTAGVLVWLRTAHNTMFIVFDLRNAAADDMLTLSTSGSLYSCYVMDM